MKPIPAIWRIDVEPDDHQPGRDLPPWNGFVAMCGLIEKLRGRLADLSGTAMHPSWFVRLDPDIEHWYGRTDYVVDRYHDLFKTLALEGDPFGIHVHFYRWDDQREASFSDHADDAWTGHCVEVAADTFQRCFGERVRRSSQGGFFLSGSVVDRCAAVGIEVDVTAEPGCPAYDTAGGTFGAYSTAPSTDFVDFPRYPYYPSQTALTQPATSPADARPIFLVPLSAYDYERASGTWRERVVKRFLRPNKPLPLNPWKEWPDPYRYWDFVARAADEGPMRYVAFAVRTHGPDSKPFQAAARLFEALPYHPIAKRLRFVDPLAPEIRSLADIQKQRWLSQTSV